MDLHEKDWKEKFDTKHNAKKEIMELKHKQNIENEEQKLKKKSFVKEVIDGINEKKQIELEEKRRVEEEKLKLEEERIQREKEEKIRIQNERKQLRRRIMIVGFIIMLIGFLFGKPDSGLQMIGSVGFIGCIVGLVLLLKKDKDN